MRKYGGVGPQIYGGHNADVQKLIPKEQLLVYDVRERWTQLCTFLGVPVPDEPFPNLNDSQAVRGIYFGKMSFGLFFWAMYTGGAVGLGWLALHPEYTKILAQSVVEWVSDTFTRFRLR